MSLADVPVGRPLKRSRDGWVALRWPVLWIVANAVVGVLMAESAMFATAHGAVVVLAAAWAAFFGRRIELAVWAAAYVAASDVLWRMTNAHLPHEIGKWGTVAVLCVVWARWQRQFQRSTQPLLFLALLVPSAAITVVQLPFDEARQQVSAAVGGGVALAVGVIVLRQLLADESELARVLWVLLGPISAVSAIAGKATLQADEIRFEDASNFVASGGFGPNQVSTVLGLGVLVCLLLALASTTWRQRALLGCVGVWYAGQALLTFSRGGAYSFGIAVSAVALVGLLTRGQRSRAALGAVAAVLVVLVAFSWVDTFTGGALEERFDNRSTTSRGDLALADLEVWRTSPVWGVGPGLSSQHRDLESSTLAEASGHTEYTRLVAEHGLLGLAAVGLLLSMAVTAYREASLRWNKLVVAGLCSWTLVTMTHSATKVALVAFAFALANLRVRERPVDRAEPALTQ